MTDPYTWLAVAVLAVTTYLAALKFALLAHTQVAVEQHLTRRGRPHAAPWLAHRCREAIFAVSFLRTLSRIAFFVVVLAEVVDLGPAGATLTWKDLLVTAAIAAPLLWLCSSVVAAAVARYIGVGLVTTALPLLRVIYTLFWPLLASVTRIDEAVRRLSAADGGAEEEREELLQAIEETHREGALDEEAATMLENVVEFSGTDVGEIMTPRTEIVAIEMTDDLAKIRDTIIKTGLSRIPVYAGDVDHILGVLYARDLVPFLGTDAKGFQLKPLLRQATIVPETKLVTELLAEFRSSEVHMAIVIDEYGGTAGLVTIEDVLEEIVGEIRDEHEPQGDDEPALVKVREGHVEVDGGYSLYDLNESLGLHLPEDTDYDTVAGFVLAHLGHVPRVGETFEAHNARFTALAASPRRLKRVGIELLGNADAAGNGNDLRETFSTQAQPEAGERLA